MIKRSFDFMDKDMFLILFKSIVRPHLEYGSSVWSVIYKKRSHTIGKCSKKSHQTDKKIYNIRPTRKD
jgi:hypothetical protein